MSLTSQLLPMDTNRACPGWELSASADAKDTTIRNLGLKKWHLVGRVGPGISSPPKGMPPSCKQSRRSNNSWSWRPTQSGSPFPSTGLVVGLVAVTVILRVCGLGVFWSYSALRPMLVTSPSASLALLKAGVIRFCLFPQTFEKQQNTRGC